MKLSNEFYCAILSLPSVYDYLYTETTNDRYGANLNVVKQKIFTYVRRNSTRGNVPDYVFRKIEEQIFRPDISIRQLYKQAVCKLSEMLYWRDGHIYVKDELFEEWQLVVTKVSPLHIISYFIYHHEYDITICDKFAHSLLPSIFNKNLDYLARKYSFNDLHIHLNGSTEADFIWLELLNNISQFAEFIEASGKNKYATEQFLDVADNRPQNKLHDLQQQTCGYKKDIVKNLGINEEDVTSILDEMNMFVQLWEHLDDNSSQELNVKVYLYILNYNYFYQLLIQQIYQIGFDQFQKITFNEMRELTERKYANRYKQLQSPYKGYDLVIEGRFAPKSNVAKNSDMLDVIQYPLSSKQESSVKINLIGHFIKQEDHNKVGDNFCRHATLRKDLDVKLDHLLEVLKQPKYKLLVHGFDSAANELHAPPEVFCKIFSRLKDCGYSNFTFHAGEDFIDIVSGIRYIYEVVEFLQFAHGNRIGHGTAIGINPRLWKDRLGKEVAIPRGEYLDNLLMVYKFILDFQITSLELNKIKQLIMKLAHQIYDNLLSYDIDILVDAWMLRKYDPEEFFKDDKLLDRNMLTKQLFNHYHYNKDVKSKYHELIMIDTDFLSDELLITLQNTMLDMINDRGIVIESLITSNVRISYYNNYYEHHLFRWLGLEKGFENAPKPTVVIGSDDPGIFVTNIRNEICHIYLVLKNYYKLSESCCWQIIEQLLKNNEIYLFDNGQLEHSTDDLY